MVARPVPVAGHLRPRLEAPGIVPVLLLAGAPIGLAAAISPTTALAVAAGALFVLAAFRDLAAGVALFTLLIFFEQLPSFGSRDLSSIKLAGGVLVVAWLIAMLGEQSRRQQYAPPTTWFVVAAVVLGSLALVSAVWATDPESALTGALRLGQGIVLALVVVTAVREPRHVSWVVGAFVTGAVATAAVGLLTGSGPSQDAVGDRLGGGIQNPNELAAALVAALALVGFAIAGGFRRRGVLVACAALLVGGLFLTQSRGGLVALLVAGLAAVGLGGSFRRRAIVTGVALGIVVAGAIAFVATPDQRSRLTSPTAGGGTGRTTLWSVALSEARDHPVVGVGMENFEVLRLRYVAGPSNLDEVRHVIDESKPVHNTFLQFFAELGVAGLGAFVLLVGSALLAALRAARSFAAAGRRRDEALARGVLVALVAALTAFSFHSGHFEKTLWLLLGLAVALPSVARAVASGPQQRAFPPTSHGERLPSDPSARSSGDRAADF